ncbi:MAG: hypothetical protein ACYDB7_05380, partial [Mycobacteriales bacterium]
EDDDAIATQLERGLRRVGYQVHRVATGLEALAAPAADVALLDSGYQTWTGRKCAGCCASPPMPSW